MEFRNDRLQALREELGITKADAARKLNMSAMGYGRYEKGERTPSFQTVCFIADTFGTTSDYLYGLTDTKKADTISVSASNNPELYILVEALKGNSEMLQRVSQYYSTLSSKEL